MKKRITILIAVAVLFITPSCDKNNDFVIFSIEDDKKLGAQVASEIASKPQEFPVLDREEYSKAYDYLQDITNRILNSDQVTYREEFNWTINIIHDDNVLNAFATPGGYIYVYTGLIKYLDKEDDLAGVIGHEIAHADQRHSSKQLQRAYGIQILLSVILGNDPSSLEQIVGALAGNLATLQFSRSFEEEADQYSVKYLSQTQYQCNGAHSFFEKLLEEEKAGNTPKFLSTHPAPQDRVDAINTFAQSIGCDMIPDDPSTYQNFKNMLP